MATSFLSLILCFLAAKIHSLTHFLPMCTTPATHRGTHQNVFIWNSIPFAKSPGTLPPHFFLPSNSSTAASSHVCCLHVLTIHIFPSRKREASSPPYQCGLHSPGASNSSTDVGPVPSFLYFLLVCTRPALQCLAIRCSLSMRIALVGAAEIHRWSTHSSKTRPPYA